MTSEREHAEALLDHYKTVDAATDELAYELYQRLLAEIGWKDYIRMALRTAQELVKVECERGLGATMDLGAFRSPLRGEADLREVIRELGGKS